MENILNAVVVVFMFLSTGLAFYRREKQLTFSSLLIQGALLIYHAHRMIELQLPGNPQLTLIIGIYVIGASIIIPFFQDMRAMIVFGCFPPLGLGVAIILFIVLGIAYVGDLRDGLGASLVMIVYSHMILSVLDVIRDRQGRPVVA